MNSNTTSSVAIHRDRTTLVELNNKTSIQAFFEAHVEKFPNHPAVSEETTMTYAELNHKANQLAHYLLKFDVQPETLIIVSMERSIEFIISVLGILKAGCVYVPLDFNQPKERLNGMLKDNEAPFLITKAQLQEQFSNYDGEKIYIDADQDVISTMPENNPSTPIAENQLAYVIYTSGSTGKPKGVLVEHRSLINHSVWFAHYSHAQAGQRIDFSSSYAFDMAITTYLVALMLGLHVVICSDETKKDIREFLQFLSDHQINITKITPSFFKILVQQVMNYQMNLPALQTIILGGEKLPNIDCMQWLKLYPHHILYNEYGPTEAAIAVLDVKISKNNVDQFDQFIPIGKPNINYGMYCYILNKDGSKASIDTIGELHIGGVNLARGYLNRLDLTNEKFIYHPLFGRLYKTGDLCRYLMDETIEYVGRIDDQVKIRGFRVELNEIEHQLKLFPTLKDVAVIAKEISAEEKQLVAYFITKENEEVPTPQMLRAYLQTYLPEYMIPIAFVPLDVFPLNENGKLDKKALPNPEFLLRKNYLEPKNDMQKKLQSIWSEVLSIKQISIDDNFFELGGHSLSAARIISRIEQSLRKLVSLKNFYAYPNIKDLSDYLAGTQDQQIQEEINTTNITTIALSDFQFLFWISYIFEPKVKKLNIVARRRLSGQLDRAALDFAFNTLIKKHKILSYKIASYSPTQHVREHLAFHIIEKDLTQYSSQETENILSGSMTGLINESRWKKNSPLLIAKLFYLPGQSFELQICMPHIVADDASEDIIFKELSKFYNAYLNKHTTHLKNESVEYLDYVRHERSHLKTIESDLQFWENYLQDANLFEFPASVIDHHCKEYSSYLNLPERSLQNIQRISQHHQISFVDLLCAAIVISLKKSFVFPNQKNKKILINIIRSTREREMFENMIGCFLRLDPVKVDLLLDLNLIDLAKHIRASMLDIAKHQYCGSMLKVACMTKKYWQDKRIFSGILNVVSKWYAKLFPKFELHPQIISLYARLKALRTPRHFLININLFHNFIEDPHAAQSQLFNCKPVNLNIFQYDLSTIDNVLDICFLRDDARDHNYLVVSSNLLPSFRERLGHFILEAMAND